MAAFLFSKRIFQYYIGKIYERSYEGYTRKKFEVYRMHPENFLGNKFYSMKLRYVFQFFYRQNISKKPRSTVAGNDEIPKIV